MLRCLPPGFTLGPPQSPLPSVKRGRGEPFIRAESHNALPTGLLTLNHFPPILLPIRTPGLRHRLVLRMPWDESYPGIQPTTARKAGDLLTFTAKLHA
ncbi:MAG: hypothetical protein ABSG67_04225 [Thermoguttaceae bacterium]